MAADLDGDGNDEAGFYRRSDGRLQWHNLTATGALGTKLSARDLSPTWTSIVTGNVTGRGDREIAFYRSTDGSYNSYALTSSGQLGARRSPAGHQLSANWAQVVTADFDGDSDRELAFYQNTNPTWHRTPTPGRRRPSRCRGPQDPSGRRSGTGALSGVGEQPPR